MNSIEQEEFSPPDQKQIEENLDKFVRLFIQTLLPFVLFCFSFFFENEEENRTHFSRFVLSFRQLLSEDRLEFLFILFLLLKTADENVGSTKSEILQLEILGTGLNKIDLKHFRSGSSLPKKPSWISSDLIWFDVLSLKNLFEIDDSLSHLSDLILSNENQWKSFYQSGKREEIPRIDQNEFSLLDQFVIIRLLRSDVFRSEMRKYLLEYFHLDQIELKDFQLKNLQIVTIPSIRLKSIDRDEYLLNQIDFDEFLNEKYLNSKGKICSIDCQLIDSIEEIPSIDFDQFQMIFLKNVPNQSFGQLVKQIQRKIIEKRQRLFVSIVSIRHFRSNIDRHFDHKRIVG